MECSFGLLRIGGGLRPPPCPDETLRAASTAARWWRAVSSGRWEPRPIPLPPVQLDSDPARWCAGGGMGTGPRNAAGLARAALAALPRATLCPEAVVLVVDAPVAPHAWRVAEGGVPVAPGRWVRRYAALPRGASLGAWAHEVAHLLLRWPDLPGSDCLMGVGAHQGGGHAPAPPGPALALSAGWIELLPADPSLPARALGPARAMALHWQGQDLLITCDGQSFAIHPRHPPAAALAAGPVPDPTLPLLNTVAAALARLPPP